MTTLETEPHVHQAPVQGNPTIIFETLNRYQQTFALKGAIDLDLFTHIAAGAVTVHEIADRCHGSERGIRILCDFLTIHGFLEKTTIGYRPSKESALFLDKESSTYIGSIASFVAGPAAIARFADVAALIRKGSPLDGHALSTPENELWVDFARYMTPMVAPVAQRIAAIISEPGRRIKVLDIAAGHGLFGISVARCNPAAEIVAVDWRNVLAVAKENASMAGLTDRFRTVEGDAFEVPFGTGFDLVLIPNFLHHFDESTNIRFLKKVRAAMNPGGKVATVEFVPNEDRISPPIAASFSFTMLAATESGDAYTLRQLERMFHAAGFGNSDFLRLDPTPFSLISTAW